MLGDCLEHPDVVRSMYDLAIEGIQGERRVFFGVFSRSPESVLYRAVQLLEPFIPILRRLRQIADAASGQFRSDGFSRLFATLRQELDEPYLQVLQEHLRALRFPDGVLMSAELGPGNRGVRYILRSLGVARRMLQCGMFVPAERMAASVCGGLFSHFKREEDPTMRRGKLDEELARMRGLVDHMVPGCILLSNESFASTNEREGSEIARQLAEALLDSGVRVLMVTHLFDLAQGLFGGTGTRALFLRAQREPDGLRTFRVVPGAPLPTSHGQDLYTQIFGSQG